MILTFLSCLVSVAVGGCGAQDANGPYSSTITPGLHPRLAPDDAVRLTREYLDAQTPELASPNLHRPPHVESVVAVQAENARSLDGCIPVETSSDIVWVTKGTGDYLNLAPRPWSQGSGNATHDGPPSECSDPGTSGTIVIDDATGNILGVYPSANGARPTPYHS